ncbi:hypothetical protein BV25DRAFT_1869840 [Artomyces pyxidatus]|uniref:Uncharacterized protein n=1 Tax=Artomyces pyxidatus TaxID=48021 RepID=A0ACB8T5U5_9AGAM|nr:hypothetical protein BV25DRAFT_1869840 [Artomyces pyxidatus]
MVRGSGKFKTKRGGGRNFSRNLQLDENGTAVSLDKPRTRRGAQAESDDDDDSDEEEEEEEESDEEEEEGGGPSGGQQPGQPELTRTERRELKKKQAAEKAQKAAADGDEEEDEFLVNPNRVAKKLNISDLNEPRELSRKEREAKDKQETKDRYWKLHVQGKTDQAKADLGRLAKIRQEREAAQAKRKAEAEAKAKEIEAKQAAAKR